MRHRLRDRRVAARGPIIGIALVTAASVALGLVGWALSFLVAFIF